jgi:hypothetical protein
VLRKITFRAVCYAGVKVTKSCNRVAIPFNKVFGNTCNEMV